MRKMIDISGRRELRKFLLALAFMIAFIPGVFAAASFQVTLLTCTPSESKINTAFSCTVNVRNSGDAAGTIGTVTLIPDSNNWLESANYPKTVNSNLNPGESAEVTFSGLKGVKAGNNAFSQVNIDNAADTSAAVTGVRVNIINVAVAVSNSKSSAVMSSTFTSSAEVTAGGNVDVTLTFAVDSGGCGIGNQDSQKTISGMQNGNKQSRTWTVTMGTSGDCKYTISASATGSGGAATKTDSTKSTITCSDCPVSSSAGASTSGGGGGGGVVKAALGELKGSVVYDLSADEKVSFLIGGENHSVHVLNLTETSADIEVRSSPQRFTLNVGDEKKVDLTGDGKEDIAVKLNSVNVLTKKAKITVTSLALAEQPATQGPQQGPSGVPSSGAGAQPSGGTGTGTSGGGQGEASRIWLIIAVLIVAIVTVIVIVLARRRR